jgi:hypothetical protein
MTEKRLSVQFGNMCIEVEAVAKRPKVPNPSGAKHDSKVLSIIRCAPNAQVSSRHTAEYATVCPSRMCWHCCDELSNVLDTKRLPTALNRIRRAVCLEGYFCSWECAKAYSFDLMDNEGIGRRASVFQCVFKDIFDEDPPYIIPAPSKFAQRSFGGSMEPDEFRRNVDGALNAMPFMSRLTKVTIHPGDWFTYAM